MIKIAIGFLLGCLGVLSLPSLPGTGWTSLAFLGLIIALSAKKWGLFWFLLGGIWAGVQASLVLHDRLPLNTPNQDFVLQGQIIGLPAEHTGRLIFEFIPSQSTSRHNTTSLPKRLRVSWYFPPQDSPKAGEKWQLRLRIKPVHGVANPGGSDYERRLFIQHIGATAYVRNSTQNHRLKPASNLSIDHWRQQILSHLRSLLTDTNNLGLIEGLTVGYRADISKEQWQVLQKTGTSHLMAISGLHIGLVAVLGFVIWRWIWAQSYRLLHLFPANQAGAIGGIISALGYALLAGFSIPTQRAFIMVVMVMLAWLIRRRHNPLPIIALSLLVILMLDPLAVLSVGLWLSYAAVCLLLMGHGKYGKKALWQGARRHFLLALGLTPLLLLFFGQISLVSPLANLLAIPLVSFITVPLLLISVICMAISNTLALLMLNLANYSLDLLWHILTTMASWSLSSLTLPELPLSIILLLAIAALLVLMPRGIPGRSLALLALAPFLLFTPKRPEKSAFWFDLLDVGQGLAAVVQTNKHCLIFDTGPAFPDSYDAGSNVIVPFLHARGIAHIDTLIVSHGDNDHIGGANTLIAYMRPAQILSSVPERLTAAKHCYAGQQWQWDGVNFEILAPSQSDQGSDNNLSCVLRVSNSTGSVLLTGDIENKAEHRLVERFGHYLHTKILVAPHHGSRTSSTVKFVDTVDPQYVLFPVGFHNRFHFPASEILARYQRRGVIPLMTDNSGMIEFRSSLHQPLSLVSWREEDPHIWRWKTTE